MSLCHSNVQCPVLCLRCPQSVRNKLIVMGLTEDALLQLFTLLDTETWMHFGVGGGGGAGGWRGSTAALDILEFPKIGDNKKVP